jgi:invasion protein IalB
MRLLFALLLSSSCAHAATLAPNLTVPAVQQIEKPQPLQPGKEAQEQPPHKPPAGPGWLSNCTSESRKSPVECSVEETLVTANTGQFVAAVAVRLRPNAREPVMTIRIPVGLYLPAGLNINVDDGKPLPVPLQTCDQQGCYGETSVNAVFLAALKGGKRLSLTFQNMAKSNVVLLVPLENFADAFQKIQ